MRNRGARQSRCLSSGCWWRTSHFQQLKYSPKYVDLRNVITSAAFLSSLPSGKSEPKEVAYPLIELRGSADLMSHTGCKIANCRHPVGLERMSSWCRSTWLKVGVAGNICPTTVPSSEKMKTMHGNNRQLPWTVGVQFQFRRLYDGLFPAHLCMQLPQCRGQDVWCRSTLHI